MQIKITTMHYKTYTDAYSLKIKLNTYIVNIIYQFSTLKSLYDDLKLNNLYYKTF